MTPVPTDPTAALRTALQWIVDEKPKAGFTDNSGETYYALNNRLRDRARETLSLASQADDPSIHDWHSERVEGCEACYPSQADDPSGSNAPMTREVAMQLEFDRRKNMGGVRPDDDEQRALRESPDGE